jgi:hypothetical protein
VTTTPRKAKLAIAFAILVTFSGVAVSLAVVMPRT